MLMLDSSTSTLTRLIIFRSMNTPIIVYFIFRNNGRRVEVTLGASAVKWTSPDPCLMFNESDS